MSERRRIQVSSGRMRVVCELNDSRTARALLSLASGAPPVRETGKLQGGELYFLIPLRAWYRFLPDLIRKRVVQVGDVAYWPRGGYLCLFFGTGSEDSAGEIRPVAPVVVVGKIVEGLDQLSRFEDNSMVEMKRVP